MATPPTWRARPLRPAGAIGAGPARSACTARRALASALRRRSPGRLRAAAVAASSAEPTLAAEVPFSIQVCGPRPRRRRAAQFARFSAEGSEAPCPRCVAATASPALRAEGCRPVPACVLASPQCRGFPIPSNVTASARGRTACGSAARASRACGATARRRCGRTCRPRSASRRPSSSGATCRTCARAPGGVRQVRGDARGGDARRAADGRVAAAW